MRAPRRTAYYGAGAVKRHSTPPSLRRILGYHRQRSCYRRRWRRDRSRGKAEMLQYLRNSPGVFSPETVDVMAGALDEAWELFKSGWAQIDDQAEVARTALAKHIVDMVKQGERDRQRLIEGALLRLKL